MVQLKQITMTAVNLAFSDMKEHLEKKKKELNKPDETFVVGKSHVYTKEARRLNKDLGITYLNQHFNN